MRIGLAIHAGRISPVLDVAHRLLVVEHPDRASTPRQEVPIAGVSLPAIVRNIQSADVGVLICGAVSQPLAAAISAAGIRLISQVCGDIEEVVAAYFAGRLHRARFQMPGCQCRRHDSMHCRRRHADAQRFPNPSTPEH